MAFVNNVMVDVQLPKELVLRIQSKSEMPAVEGLAGILSRVLDDHDKRHPNPIENATVAAPTSQEPKFFKTSRGSELPVGLDLFADYGGKHITAKVTDNGIEYNGKKYEVSPSAFAAKKDCGATDTAASTNGWKFWMYDDKGRARFIDAFR